MTADDWQPIATAPRDGTRIIVWHHISKISRVSIARYEDAWIDDDDYRVDPTDWMPLPEPPKEGG